MICLKEKAEIYRLGLIAGIFSKDDVINWVDAVIGEESNIDYALIEVSLNSTKNLEDIALELKNVKGEFDSKIVASILIGILALKFEENHDLGSEIASMLHKFAHNSTVLDNEVISKINELNDGFYLAEQEIYGNLKDMTIELHDFLKDYINFGKEF